MTNVYAALEIGTSRTVLAVGAAEAGERLKVVAHAQIPSSGVRKSAITNMNHATSSVRSVLNEIERRQIKKDVSLSISNAFLVVNGAHIKADPYQATIPIEGSKVKDADVDRVLAAAREWSLPRERELLDIVDQTFAVDTHGGISEPRGMSGRVLKLNTLQIHADANRIADARTAATEAHLDIREALCALTCAGDAALTERDRRDGVLHIDFGGGSTGFAVYADGCLAAADTIAVGGDHVTNDIAYAFRTTAQQAETIKIDEACALVRPEDGAHARIGLPGKSPLVQDRTISRHGLDTVVNARMKEILGIIRDSLDEHGFLGQLNAGIVVTGGGAALAGLEELIRRELAMSVRKGVPFAVDGLEDAEHPESYAAIAGALAYAHRNYERKSLLGNLFGGLFK